MFLFWTIVLLQQLRAQSKIEGTVVNVSGQPLSNVNVLLLRSADSVLVKGIVSDNMGTYQFNDIPVGKYLLSFTYTGLKKIYTSAYSVTGAQDNVIVGKTQMTDKDIQLSKVEVTAKKPLFEQKIDRLVINVRNSITAAGSNALDVLERSPGVIVDRHNNVLSMGGKEGVLVMINGKESNLPSAAIIQMLAGMSSANIEKIELITTPPANFSAEGNAGIINIVLVDNSNFGTNGGFAVSWGEGKTKIRSASLNFNHRKGKLNLYGDYSYVENILEQYLFGYRKSDFGGDTKETFAANNRNAESKNFTGRLGIDIQLTKKTSVGAMVSGYSNRWTSNAINETSLLLNQQLDTFVYGKNYETNNWRSISGNLNAQHILKKGGRLSASIDYLYYHDRNPNEYLNSYSDESGNFIYDQEVRSEKVTPISFWVISGGYTGKLGKKTELQTGFKFTRSGFTNDILVARMLQDVWVNDPSYSANYELKENISAAYISFNTNINPKTNIKAGLRYEYTNSNLGTDHIKNIVDRRYGKLFPSFFISRKITDNSGINFSYSRRITRPGFNDLAPFTIFFDPNSLTTGNPALQASIADAINTSYSYKNYIFSLSYSYEAGAIARFQPKIDPATNKQISSPENLKSLEIAAVTFSIPVNVRPWWSMQNNFIGRWQETNSIYKGVNIAIGQKGYRIASTQSFKIPGNFSIDVSGYYQSGDIRGKFLVRPLGAFDFGIQKKTEKGKGKISFTITDIFNSTKQRAYINEPEQNLVVRRELQFTRRMFKLTYTRSFGNSKLEVKKRTDNSEDERKRVE